MKRNDALATEKEDAGNIFFFLRILSAHYYAISLVP